MFLWLSKKEKNAFQKLNLSLETLLEQQETCQDRQRRLDRRIDDLDLDMSSLYDKVQKYQSALGGRRSKRKKADEENADQVDDLNERILRGELDASIQHELQTSDH